jgi:hypothetical protein
MDAQALRTIIRTKLEDGRLPIDKAPRVWGGGAGRGETCAACETMITQDQLCVEGIPLPVGPSVVLHVKCFQVWDQERRTLKS